MGTFSKLVISVPLLAGIGMLGVGSMNAAVKNLQPSEAVELLARSEAIDAKCRHLSDAEHQELRDYVARAEVAVASQTSAASAGRAVTRGSNAGKASTCGRSSETTVRATMDAARRAVAGVRQPTIAPAKEFAKKKRKKQKKVTALRTNTVDQNSSRVTGSAAKYSRLAAAYYVERRCKHLSHAQAVDFWKRIVRMHKAVLASSGPSALSIAKSRAIARAKATGGCSSRSAKLVRTSYRTIRRK